MSALGETLAILAGVFDGRGDGWYVFGAQAVALRGAPRATQDIDVTVSVHDGDSTALLAALERAGLPHRYPDKRDELLRDAAVLPLQSPSSGMEVDVVLAGTGLEELALSRAERLDVEGIHVPVASATDLVVMKVLGGRGKDLDDVRALLAGGQVDVPEARSLLGQFEEALERSDLVALLVEAVASVRD